MLWQSSNSLAATGEVPKGAVAAITIFLAALVLILPLVFTPLRLNDSFWIDHVWLDQFARQVGNGVFYPRWLPISHGGLGSPVFYYYPPLAFYAGTPFILAGMDTQAALSATFFAGYLLAGGAMYAWLRSQTAANPLLGALVFMAAPYHTFNLYNRGALAEFTATALLPLVALSISKLNRVGGSWFALTSVVYAALIATHLPLALLASVFLVAPIACRRAYLSQGTVVPIALALALGVGLACITWLPAIWLEPYRDSAKLWSDPVLQPSNWTLWNPHFRTERAFVGIVLIGASLALPLSVLAWRNHSGWAVLGLVCIALAIGTVPQLWSLPLLRSAQFPFRVLPLAEFALATAIASLSWRSEGLTLRLTPLLALSAFTIAARPVDQGVSEHDVFVSHADVPENLPPGDRPYSWPSRWALSVATEHPSVRVAEGVTTEPTFFFPSWQVRCGQTIVPTYAAPDTKLLAYRGEDCTKTLVWTNAERVAGVLSVVSFLILILAVLKSRRRLPLPASSIPSPP